MASRKGAFVAATAVALTAFALYRSTLLPGLDFGDTPSFQVMGGNAAITPRDAYPLYFALGAPFVWLTGDPAHGLNIASAVEGALAAGLLVLVGVELSAAILPSVAAAALFASSYTFWSQAIITEVYALHALMVALSLWLLLRWERQPTLPRLALFFAAFALGFGNHLAMVLLLPGFTLFLLIAAPGGWRTVVTPNVIALAVVTAVLGALQYAWNLRSLWLAPVPPSSLAAALTTFWFDVTKADWRATMVDNVPGAMASGRARMYAFDLRQQFGLAGPCLALFGLVTLARSAPRRAWLMAVLYASNVAFALTYNVGDSHVFFLPSHLMLALLVAPALAALDRVLSRIPGAAVANGGLHMRVPVASLAACAAVAFMTHANFPALDRSADHRPTALLEALTAGIDGHGALLVTNLNWQAQNGMNYFAKFVRPDAAVADSAVVGAHAPALIADNIAIGRRVVVTTSARTVLQATYPGRFAFVPEPGHAAATLAERVRRLPPGTRYAVTILKPPRGLTLNANDLQQALDELGAPRTFERIAVESAPDYAAVAGVVGAPPRLMQASQTPFSADTTVESTRVVVRMESWLDFDTIRRMGFGQVVAAGRHALIVERGVSFVAFDADGRAIDEGYWSSLFAPEARWAIVSP